MKNIPYISLFYFLFLSAAFTQKGSINGIVSDASGPLSFATVGIDSLGSGTDTDTDGVFVLDNIPYGNHELTISFLGYHSKKIRVELNEINPTIQLEIQLDQTYNSLDEVVVTGTMRTVSKLQSPVPVEVYNKAFFKANPTPSVFECLQTINGIRPQLNCNVCNTGDIHINGLEGPYTMVLIDGMPIVSGLSTVYGLTGIPQSLIERVEVVKGPASTLYGSEAVGGLINIITRDPDLVPKLSLDSYGSSWQEWNADLGLKFNVGERVQLLTGINYFRYNNPIDKNNDGFTDLTLQDRISIFQKVKWTHKKGNTTSIAGRYMYEDRWGGQMNWTPEFRGGDNVYGESIYTSRWEAFGNHGFTKDQSLAFSFSVNGHSQNSVYGNQPFNANQFIGFGQLTWAKDLGIHSLLSGAVYRYTFYDDDTPVTYNNSDNHNSPSKIHLPGFFLQDEMQLSDQTILLAGLRYDYNSIHGSILTPRFNLKWSSIDQQTIVRLSVGNGYRVANIFTEDHAALTGARQVVFEEELKPETSWNTNLNIVKQWFTPSNGILTLDGSLFYTYFSNRILPDYETDPNKIFYRNLDGNSTSKGISLNLDYFIGRQWKILAGATLMDVKVKEAERSFRPLLTEAFQGVWNIGYTFKNTPLRLDYTGNAYGPMRLPVLGPLDDRASMSPWWSIQNVQITYTIKDGFEIYGGVKNLLNFTPPANSIARAFDPFDKNVVFDSQGQAVPTPDNPNALTFDPTYVYASNQGIRTFLGVRWNLN